jgi:hypothetical protein
MGTCSRADVPESAVATQRAGQKPQMLVRAKAREVEQRVKWIALSGSVDLRYKAS